MIPQPIHPIKAGMSGSKLPPLPSCYVWNTKAYRRKKMQDGLRQMWGAIRTKQTRFQP